MYVVAEIPSKTTHRKNRKFHRKRPIREVTNSLENDQSGKWKNIFSKTNDRFNAQIFWMKKFRRKRLIDWTHSRKKGVFFIKPNRLPNSIENDRSGNEKLHRKRHVKFHQKRHMSQIICVPKKNMQSCWIHQNFCAGASKNSTWNETCPNRLFPEKNHANQRKWDFFDLPVPGEKNFHLIPSKITYVKNQPAPGENNSP